MYIAYSESHLWSVHLLSGHSTVLLPQVYPYVICPSPSSLPLPSQLHLQQLRFVCWFTIQKIMTHIIVSFEVFTVLLMMILALWDMTSWWSLNSYRSFGRSCWLRLQGVSDKNLFMSPFTAKPPMFATINFYISVRNRTPSPPPPPPPGSPYFSQMDLTTFLPVGKAVSWINVRRYCITLRVISTEVFSMNAETATRVYGK
jgi:hypothetical protein